MGFLLLYTVAMATRKTTSRNTKTKANQKPTRRTQNRTQSSRVSTRPTKVKTAPRQTKAAQAKATRAEGRRILTVGRLLGVSIILYLGLAVAAVMLMKPTALPVTITHLTNDALLSQNGTVFAHADRALFDVEVRWLVAAMLGLSLVLPVLYLTKLKAFYTEHLAHRRVIGLRWLDLGVSGGLMIGVITMLIGYTDFVAIKLMADLLVITCLLGWLAERQNEKASQPAWSAYGLSLVTGTLPWLAIGLTKVSTLWFGGVRSPWYVYAVCVSTLVGFVLLGLNQLNQHRRLKAWQDYAGVERNYLTIAMLTKVAFAGILLVGLAK